MFEFEKPRIEIAEMAPDGTYGKFVVEPLERGYGTTLGNSLRRILLSSLPGAAVSNVKIDGVLHEFSVIPGVKEDVTEIILNLKGLAIKNTSEGNEPKIAYIDMEGEGEVKGSDIKADSDIEILNPGVLTCALPISSHCDTFRWPWQQTVYGNHHSERPRLCWCRQEQKRRSANRHASGRQYFHTCYKSKLPG